MAAWRASGITSSGRWVARTVGVPRRASAETASSIADAGGGVETVHELVEQERARPGRQRAGEQRPARLAGRDLDHGSDAAARPSPSRSDGLVHASLRVGGQSALPARHRR